MKRLRHLTYAATTLGAPLLLTVTTPAVVSAAAAHSAVIQGSGGISPGLDLNVWERSISFGGTATVVGINGTAPDVARAYWCSFNGSFTGNLSGGAGTFSGACGPVSFDLCVFVYTTPSLRISCANNSNGTGGGWFECVLRPHQVLPVTSFDLTCKGVWATS